MTNTEKPTTKQEKKKQQLVKGTTKSTMNSELKNRFPDKKDNDKKSTLKEKLITKDGEIKNEEKKTEKKIVKKNDALVNSYGLPISTKTSAALCKFIKNKTINKALEDLEKVSLIKKAVPMKGEIPHRKGKKIMSGRFPKKAAIIFLKLIKSLEANSNANGLEEPKIVEAVANKASRPYGRFGRVQRKRTHVRLRAESKMAIKKGRKKNGRKKHS